ncbi:MAG: 16S rRNA (uracil(1498)-N(3))-methyltransferase [Bacteroides sp.]|nr:16S rRNA (uracil(1498)-N(3))-methyltransferase [Bacteroides sp.]MCM1457048.1 16S rRNA (uracil(1498)-N(3))-methyltransferase [Lachnoclostridium sp.]
MIQFYCPDIESDPTLPESESQHCVKVLRMTEGDTLVAVDGIGRRYSCRLIDAHPKHALVEIISSEDHPLPWSNNIAVAVAPTKSIDRMEWLVEKLTEVGFNRFIPLRCRFSERKDIKRERLEKIAVSAMKQSLKAMLPQIDEMTPIMSVIKSDEYAGWQKFIAYCDPSIPRRDIVEAYIPGRDTIILIGPEGDFSPEEINAALAAGFIPVTLGDNRLRTETAALYSATAFHILDSAKAPR